MKYILAILFSLAVVASACVHASSRRTQFAPVGRLYSFTRFDSLFSKTFAIKADPFALLLGNISIACELNADRRVRWEAGLVIFSKNILSSHALDKKDGFVLRLGQKKMIIKERHLKRNLGTQPYGCLYLRRDLFIMRRHILVSSSSAMPTFFNRFDGDRYRTEHEYYQAGAGLIFNVGWEIVIADRLVMDAFAGVGLGYMFERLSNTSYISYEWESKRPGTGQGIAWDIKGLGFPANAGLKIGWILGPVKSKIKW